MSCVIVTIGIALVICVHADMYLGKPEGASCEDGGVQGTCRRAEMCPSYSIQARYHRTGCWPRACPPKPEVTVCSKDETHEVVCCTDCYIDDASKAVVTLDGVVWKTGGVRKSYDKCAEYAADLPYPCKFGKEATVKKVYDKEKKCHNLNVDVKVNHKLKPPYRVDFPSLVLLGYPNNATTPPSWLCQGFIISTRFVITTAHCGRNRHLNPVSYIVMSIFKRPQTYETQVFARWDRYNVKQFIPHPDWKIPSNYYDIGLIETATEIQFGINILPMCLSELSLVPDFVHTDVLGVDGFGNNVKVNNIEKLEDEECSAQFRSPQDFQRGIDFDIQMCYKGFNESTESCIGSFGRPIYTLGSLQCMSYAVGVTSIGIPCYIQNLSRNSIYTRIYNLLPWIESVVWPNNNNT